MSYKVVSFYSKELPAGFDPNSKDSVDRSVRALAQDKFNLAEGVFNPAARGQCAGFAGKKGYVFSVEVDADIAEELRWHPDVKAIFDPLPPQDFHTGAIIKPPKPPKP